MKEQLKLILDELRSINGRLGAVETTVDETHSLVGQTNLAAGKLHHALEARIGDQETALGSVTKRITAIERKVG
jgi:hypothetical protein